MSDRSAEMDTSVGPPVSRKRAATTTTVSIGDSSGMERGQASWGIAIEAPVQITLNGDPWTVLLASPSDVEDLALGLAITERVLIEPTAMRSITVSGFLREITVDLAVDAAHLNPAALRSRSLISNSACGFCGLESLAQLHQMAAERGGGLASASPPPTGQAAITDAAILAAFAALPAHQPLNADTHTVHAAAWCDPAGAILLVREDVGRHNALDKLIGAMARQDLLRQPGFIVMSSRCSYELVYKASAAACQLLATISAPTSMALEWSHALSLPVACRIGARDDARVVRFLEDGTDAV